MTASDHTSETVFGIPHITRTFETRHEAVGHVAIQGREAPDRIGTVMSFTRSVVAIPPRPVIAPDTEDTDR